MMTPDPQRQAFLDKIIAEPHDDVHRLVYADWIDERGESERAELIRVQIELEEIPKHERSLSNPVFSVLKARASILIDNLKTWLSWPWNKMKSKGEVQWHRGFISDVSITWEDWSNIADEIVKQHPIEEVRLLTWPEVEFLGTDDGVKYWFSNRPDQFIISDVTERARKTRARLFKLNWPTVGRFILPDGWDQVAHHEETHTVLPLEDNPPMQYYPPSP